MAYFEDRIRLTGFRVCDNKEQSIRSNAASLMHSANDIRTSASLKLICLHDSIVFSPPLFINNIYHRQSIPHKNIIGFFLAPTYNTRLVLVVQEENNKTINLYGIQLSSIQKAQDITSLLGESRPSSSGSSITRSPTYTVSTTLTNSVAADPIAKANIPISQNPYGSHRHHKLDNFAHSESKFDVDYEKYNGIPTQSKRISRLQNGYDHINKIVSSTHSRRTPIKFPGIISSDIECDWDDIMTPTRPKQSDEIEERISIGYYNDDGEPDDSPRMSPKKIDSDSRPSTPAPQNAWMENITYISNHPTKGSCVTANGSVYMYVAQQVNPRSDTQL